MWIIFVIFRFSDQMYVICDCLLSWKLLNPTHIKSTISLEFSNKISLIIPSLNCEYHQTFLSHEPSASFVSLCLFHSVSLPLFAFLRLRVSPSEPWTPPRLLHETAAQISRVVSLFFIKFLFFFFSHLYLGSN